MNPMERTYHTKKASLRFLCPLCGAQRSLYYQASLKLHHYVHIILISVVAGLVSWPLMGWKGIFPSLFVWACYELGLRSLYRKDILCPHCGFDAAWYKKDVKRARQMVQDFWTQKMPEKKPAPKAIQ